MSWPRIRKYPLLSTAGSQIRQLVWDTPWLIVTLQLIGQPNEIVKQRRERLWLVAPTSAKFELKDIPNAEAGDFEVESCLRRLLTLFLLPMLAGISLKAEK